ncbi:MAG: DUF2834 domain-containing protein [Cyanobacteria bacterium P01_C01_bin.70]
MKYVYGCLCLVGIILPFTQFVPWPLAYGLQLLQLIAEASASPISAFAWLDVLVSAIVLIGFVLHEGRKLKMRWLWLPLLGTLTVGVSLGLPLLLLLRELHLKRQVPA